MTDDDPILLSRSEHSISRKQIHTNALKVLYRLHRARYRGYLVGGAVRDLLLGRTPKDYDVATDARPPEIRRLFRNSRIIGRRFRLAHVFFREGIIEVATFRRDPDPEAQRGGPEDPLITDDNVFGTPREDAFRRDFTVNALFYDIGDFSVVDYVGGIEDLERREIRVIGDPDLRFQEDPVRMTRACELAGRLDFTIEATTQRGIHEQRREIARASPARLTEEILQILRSQRAASTMQWMVELGLSEILLPEVDAMLAAERAGLGEFRRALASLDRLVAAGREPSEIALLATVLMPSLLLERREMERERGGPIGRERFRALILDRTLPFLARFTLSKLKAEPVANAVMGAEEMRGQSWDAAGRLRLARRPWFEDALFLCELLADIGGVESGELAAWREVDRQRPARRHGAEGGSGRRRRPRRPRRGRRRRGGGGDRG